MPGCVQLSRVSDSLPGLCLLPSAALSFSENLNSADKLKVKYTSVYTALLRVQGRDEAGDKANCGTLPLRNEAPEPVTWLPLWREQAAPEEGAKGEMNEEKQTRALTSLPRCYATSGEVSGCL